MSFMPPAAGYDRAITVFSPDGRLYQVQYAEEAVKRGATAVGIKTKDAVVVLVERRISSKLMESKSFEKIFKIDDHICAATSGLIGDARVLVDKARVEAQINHLTYDEPISVDVLAKKIGDLKQMHTQYGGVRPFGASLLIAGVNSEPKLFVTHPSGALYEYKAYVIGSGKGQVLEVFESDYNENLSMEGAIKLAVKSLNKSIDEGVTVENIECAIITLKDKSFRKLSPAELKPHVDALKGE